MEKASTILCTVHGKPDYYIPFRMAIDLALENETRLTSCSQAALSVGGNPLRYLREKSLISC